MARHNKDRTGGISEHEIVTEQEHHRTTEEDRM